MASIIYEEENDYYVLYCDCGVITYAGDKLKVGDIIECKLDKPHPIERCGANYRIEKIPEIIEIEGALTKLENKDDIVAKKDFVIG